METAGKMSARHKDSYEQGKPVDAVETLRRSTLSGAGLQEAVTSHSIK